jgi:hypothetical protein
MARHTVTSDEIIRAEQTQEIVLASANGVKKLIWFPYTSTYGVFINGINDAHTSDRMTAINAYNDLP